MTPIIYPFAETKKRSFEYIKPRTPSVTTSFWDSTTGSWRDSVTTVAVAGYGRETTTSQKGSNWMSLQEMKRDGSLNRLSKSQRRYISTADLGTGGFSSIKTTHECSHERDLDVNLDVLEGNYRYRYRGPWLPYSANFGGASSLYPPVPGNLQTTMLSRGATAIARTLPTNPVAGAAQFIGELREGLPSRPGKSYVDRGGPGSLADEYINVEFGFKPLISDLRKFGEAARSSDKVIKQLERDAARLIRRRYAFPVEKTTTTTVISTSAYGDPIFRTLGPNCYESGPGKLTKTREETTRYWFSGAYTYAYPKGDSALDRMRAAESRLNRLFGTRVSPELLWELTPWSWAADWFSNAGDVIHNISAMANDSLVLRWGYIMCHYTCRDTYLLDGVALKGSTGGPRSQSFVTDVKLRNRATPYGFGLDLATLTNRQWAILVALGISRAQGML